MTTEFKKKIFDLQSEVGKISKDSKNPFYKSRYFDINKLIEHLNPLLVKYKLILLQPIQNGFVFSEIHDVDSDGVISSALELSGLKDPQKVGIEVTYFRRYTLTSLLGLQGEDDDANSISVKKKESPDKPWLNLDTKEWDNAVSKKVPIEKVKSHYSISKENEAKYLEAIK
jgi:hypothetical protein